MKKKALSVLLTTCMMTSLLAGCGAKTEPQTAGDGASLEASESAEDSSESASEAEDESEDGATKGQGGTPWVNSELKSNVTADTVVDPKDDFHLYANKDWILENEIPDGYTQWSHYAERGLEVKNQCMELLKDETIEGHDAELVRTYNSLILDWESRNKLGVTELQEGYDKIVAVKSIEDVTKLLTDEETVYDYYNFVNFGAGVGLNDPETNIVIVDTPDLLLSDSAEYSERTDYGDMYYGYRKDMFVYMAQKFGMSEDEANKCFDQAFDFETKLASKIYSTNDMYADDYYDKINNEMSFDDASACSKTFPLKEILTASGYVYDGPYLVTTPDYFSYLDEIYTEENIEAIKSLLIVKYILPFSTSVDKETYDKKNELVAQYFGMSGTVSDEEMAYDSVIDSLPDSMQIVYIEKYGSEEDRQKMTELCQMVIDTYRELLSENEWASDEVKNYAIEKLDNITIHAAYPDKFNDTTGIDLTDCSLIEADTRIANHNIEENIKLMGQKVDHEKWADGMAVTDCNAFYNPSDNSINMIIGMMGEPFYSSDMSVEELYASIGAFWVGHEISHAFDSNGAQFDAEGYYRDWWTEADKEEFQKRVGKMDDYLDTIVAFGDDHFIGSNIDTEMVADMTGLQCALRMASKVEGFDYQKFFIKYAQMNASIATYSDEFSQLTQDAHPLNYSRTNVPVQQFDEFYEAFDVKEGDNMYLAPEDRLIIW